MRNIGEPVRVAAVFDRSGKIKPVWFDWSGRKYSVETISMEWSEMQGETKLLCFSVTVGHDQFGLKYNTSNHQWTVACISS